MRIDVSLADRPIAAELARLHARMRCPGDVLHGLPELATGRTGYVFRYRETDGEFYVYVEDAARGVLAGCTTFNRVVDVDRHAGRYLRSPHSRYAPAYQRQGLASAVYRWALAAGLCLVTGPRQSPGAHGLWMALARSCERVFVALEGKRLRVLGDCVGACELDAFNTRMMLLGTGWDAQRLARVTQACGRPAAPAG